MVIQYSVELKNLRRTTKSGRRGSRCWIRRATCRAFQPIYRCSLASTNSSIASNCCGLDQGVEYIGPYDHPPEVVAARLKKNGLTQVLFNYRPGQGAWRTRYRGPARPRRRIPPRRGYRDHLRQGAEAAAEVNRLAGIAPQGADRAALENAFVAGVRRRKDAGIRLLIEPINLRDIPGSANQQGLRHHRPRSARTISAAIRHLSHQATRGSSPAPSRPTSAAISRISR